MYLEKEKKNDMPNEICDLYYFYFVAIEAWITQQYLGWG